MDRPGEACEDHLARRQEHDHRLQEARNGLQDGCLGNEGGGQEEAEGRRDEG